MYTCNVLLYQLNAILKYLGKSVIKCPAAMSNSDHDTLKLSHSVANIQNSMHYYWPSLYVSTKRE